MVLASVCQDLWYSKLRYALEYGVQYGQVSKLAEPHDCDWMTAPLGKKNCHYEPEVHSAFAAIREGKPMVTYDRGKTWSDNTNMEQTAVWITWQRVAE